MLNILIVEDDVTIRELLSYNLKKNFKILEANSAEEAMEVCEHNKYSSNFIRLDVTRDVRFVIFENYKKTKK